MPDLAVCLWRIGARPFRSIYAVVPGGTDVLIASAVVTAEIAKQMVDRHNEGLRVAPNSGGF